MKTKNVILGLCLAVVGLLMAAMPSACIKAVVVIVGLVAICNGGYNLFVDYKKTTIPQLKTSILVKSIASIVIGLVAVICPFALLKTAASIWNIVSYILAVYLILFSFYGFFTASKMRDSSPEERKRIIKESLISLLIAVLLFVIPIENVGRTFVRIIGIAGLAIGVVLIIIEVVVSKRTVIVKAEEAVVVDDSEAGTDATANTETENEAAGESSSEKEETTQEK